MITVKDLRELEDLAEEMRQGGNMLAYAEFIAKAARLDFGELADVLEEPDVSFQLAEKRERKGRRT